jgi:hypothetical protein
VKTTQILTENSIWQLNKFCSSCFKFLPSNKIQLKAWLSYKFGEMKLALSFNIFINSIHEKFIRNLLSKFQFCVSIFSLIPLQKLFLFGASSVWEIILINMSSYIIAHLFHVRLSSSHSITLLYTDSFESYEKYQRVAQKERFLRVCSRSPWIRKIMMWWNWC